MRRPSTAAIRAFGIRRRPAVIISAAAVVLAVAGGATGAALGGFAGHEGHGRGVGHHAAFLDDDAVPGR